MKKGILSVIAFLFTVSLVYAGGYIYTSNKDHLGGDITPEAAYKMAQKDPDHTFIVDSRTRAEYQYVGHINNSYNIPLRFLTTKVGKKGYTEVNNSNFGKDLLNRFNPKTDTLIILCRSGNRSCTACNESIKIGFDENKVFNMMGGFEGGKNKNKASIFNGKRWAGGWKLEGLPWTYKMDKKFMYQPDIKG
jgi:rhodanese-related sulfurtransferase